MTWELILFCGVITFLIRYSMLSGASPKELPKWAYDALVFVPIAVLTTIIVPEVLMASGNVMLKGNFRIVAALLASVAALTFRSVTATIVIGMFSFWAMEWLF
jgi:branched-subunit amino acid transport protein|tara:strand:- start:299 stop:607 length:309 start_codon:yes stop_codon:yes gene_type:complete